MEGYSGQGRQRTRQHQGSIVTETGKRFPKESYKYVFTQHPSVLGNLVAKKIFKTKKYTQTQFFPPKRKKQTSNWVEGIELDQPQEMKKEEIGCFEICWV